MENENVKVWRNKKAAKLSSIVIATIAFIIIILAFTTTYAGVVSDYDIEQTENVSDQYDKLDEIHSVSQQVFSEVEQINKTTESDIIDNMVKGSYNAMKLSLSSFTYVNSIIQQAGKDFGIPSYFITGALAMFFIVVAFAIISALFKGDK